MIKRDDMLEREAPKPPPVPRLDEGLVAQPAHTAAEPLPIITPKKP